MEVIEEDGCIPGSLCYYYIGNQILEVEVKENNSNGEYICYKLEVISVVESDRHRGDSRIGSTFGCGRKRGIGHTGGPADWRLDDL